MTPAEITKQTSIRALKRMLIVERDSTRCAQMHKAWSLMAGAGWTGGYPNELRSEYLVRLMHPLLNERISLIVQWNKYSETVALVLRPLALQVGQIYPKIRKMDRRTTMPELMDALRAGYKDGSYDERFALMKRVPVLILDDLGTENASDWVAEKLFQLFNARYLKAAPTVVTTNLDIEAAEAKLSERVRSRLLDRKLSTVVQLPAGDYRVAEGKAG